MKNNTVNPRAYIIAIFETNNESSSLLDIYDYVDSSWSQKNVEGSKSVSRLSPSSFSAPPLYGIMSPFLHLSMHFSVCDMPHDWIVDVFEHVDSVSSKPSIVGV